MGPNFRGLLFPILKLIALESSCNFRQFGWNRFFLVFFFGLDGFSGPMWIPHIYLRLLGVSPNRLQLTIHVKVSRKNNDRFTNASYTEVSYCLWFGKILWIAMLIGSDKLWSGLISPLSHFPSEPAPTQAQAQTLSSTLEPQQRWTKLIAFHANHYVFRRTSIQGHLVLN